MTHPDKFRAFYVAPDMSFCGFAPNNVFEKKKVRDSSLKEGIKSVYLRNK